MSDDELKITMARIADLFPRAKLTDSQLEEWSKRLRRYDAAHVSEALGRYMAANKYQRVIWAEFWIHLAPLVRFTQSAVAKERENPARAIQHLARTEWWQESNNTADPEATRQHLVGLCNISRDVDVIFTHLASCWDSLRESDVEEVGKQGARAFIYAAGVEHFLSLGQKLDQAIASARECVGLKPGETIKKAREQLLRTAASEDSPTQADQLNQLAGVA